MTRRTPSAPTTRQTKTQGPVLRFPSEASSTSCPHCHKPFGPTDGLTVTRVGWGRKIEGWIFPTTICWSIIVVIGTLTFTALYVPPADAPLERGLGWFLVYAPLIPGGILTMISWCFPRIRIYHCRHCGETTEAAWSGHRGDIKRNAAASDSSFR